MISQQREIGDSYDTRMKIKGILSERGNYTTKRYISRRVNKDVRSVCRILIRMEELGEVESMMAGSAKVYRIKVLNSVISLLT